MQVGILTKEPNTYDIQVLKKAFDKLNTNVVYIDYSQDIPESKIVASHNKLDIIFPRHIPKYIPKVISLVELFTKAGVFSPNSAEGIRIACSKSATEIALRKNDIKMPKSLFFRSAINVNLIESTFNYPFIAKSDTGSQGREVHLIETRRGLEEILPELNLYDGVLFQEYIVESHGEDVRAFVVGNMVVAAMVRKSKASKLVSNFHQGGSVSQTELSTKEETIAVLAAQSLGLGVAGVDILRSKRGPLVIELNSSPGYQGIESATNISVAELVARFTIEFAQAFLS